MKNLQLVVPDATAARNELLDRGVQVSKLTVITNADGGTRHFPSPYKHECVPAERSFAKRIDIQSILSGPLLQ